jgi:hypothetical protein
MANKKRADSKRIGLQEDKLIRQIDIVNLCGDELKQLRAATRKKSFATSLKLQNEAVLIARGIDLKIRALYTQAEEYQDITELTKEIRGIIKNYGGQFERQNINLNTGTIKLEIVRGDISGKEGPGAE